MIGAHVKHCRGSFKKTTAPKRRRLLCLEETEKFSVKDDLFNSTQENLGMRWLAVVL